MRVQRIGSRGRRVGSTPGPPGVALVLTLLLVGLLLVMATTLLSLSASDYQVANNEMRSVQALFNADAGTEEAKMRLSPNAPTAAKIPIATATNWRAYILSGHSQAEVQTLDPTYGKAAPNFTVSESTANYVFYNTVQTGSGTIPWGWARVQHKVDASGNIKYLDVVTGAETTNATQLVGGNTVTNQPIVVVTSEGLQAPVRRMIAMELQPIISTTTSTNTVVTDPFADAAHGRSWVELIGNAWTDSYNSNNGQYNVGGNRGHHGDVSTDSTANAAITLTTGSTVDGQAIVGPGGDPATGIDNQGALSITGNRTVTLSEGTYWFSSINVAGNGKLKTTGAVKVYVTGSVDIGGNGVATAGNLPPNFLLYGTVDPSNAANKCTSVSIHGNGSFYGAVYAPDAAIQVAGNAANYGALTGNTIRINGNGGFHYDEQLGNLGRTVTTTVTTTYTTTGFTRYSWREIAF